MNGFVRASRARSRCRKRTVLRPADVMSGVARLHFAVSHIKDSRRPIPTRCHDSLAIGAESDGLHPIGILPQDAQRRAVRCLKKASGPIAAASDQSASIRLKAMTRAVSGRSHKMRIAILWDQLMPPCPLRRRTAGIASTFPCAATPARDPLRQASDPTGEWPRRCSRWSLVVTVTASWPRPD